MTVLAPFFSSMFFFRFALLGTCSAGCWEAVVPEGLI